MKVLGELDPMGLEGCFIAGGAVLSKVTKTEIADYDIYPKTKEAALNACLTLRENSCFVLNITDRAITFKCNTLINNSNERTVFQVMTFDVFPAAQDIFDFFDFSVCMGAYDCDTKDYHFSDTFWPDVASKTIRFNPSTRFPLASFIRLGKYREKGYKIGKGETTKIALAVAHKGLPTSWEELESQLGGVYGKSITIQAGNQEFTLERAYEILSNLEFNVKYSDEGEFSWVGVEELEVILSDEPIVYYGDRWKVKDGALTTLTFDDRIIEMGLGEMVNKPMSECPIKYITAYKYVKKVGEGVYEGAVWSGNHKGVVYKPFEKTTHEEEPYLFSYINKKSSHTGILCEVKIPVEDLVKVNYDKYVSKSIIMGEVNESS